MADDNREPAYSPLSPDLLNYLFKHSDWYLSKFEPEGTVEGVPAEVTITFTQEADENGNPHRA